MSAADTSKSAQAAAQTQDNLLDQVIAATRPLDQQEANRAKESFGQFIAQAVKPGQVVSKDVESNIKFWINEIDKKLSSQLNEIMHHENFQKLEGTWRGLHYLVHQTETSETLMIKVINISKREAFK